MSFRISDPRFAALFCLLIAGSVMLPPEVRADGSRADAADSRAAEAATLMKEHAEPFFKKYCVSCHGGKQPKADLALDDLSALPAVTENHDRWEAVLEMVRGREMPPSDKPQPTEPELQAFTDWLQAAIEDVDCSKIRNPGHVTLRRLNRAEYDNTIRDLVGIDFHPAEDFPVDDSASGFDNISDVLSISPILMEKYLTAAEQVLERALADEGVKSRLLDRLPGRDGSPEECARDILKRFASRAYRRPIRDDELERLVQLAVAAGRDLGGFEPGIAFAMQAVLVSPKFLFLVELDGNDPDGDGIFELNQYALATRLSYFLWSSMPDQRLFDLAADGKLYEEQVLSDEVRRMLRDPKSMALVENFAGQWLQLRLLSQLQPDGQKYSAFDEPLRAAMIRETELFFQTIVQEDRSVLEFLDADYTFVNARLAKHYGIEGIEGDEFRRVELSDDRRGGVLTHASILTLTSNPTRTSPVKRGKWILDNILGTPPPPPPPEAGELSDDEGTELLGSLRERMEQHRADPSCAVCHTRMDPLGFGFENFDGIGAWREKDGRFAIDPAGELPGGLSFNGPAELRKILVAEKQTQFVRCLSEKLLTYALGRAIGPYDRCAVQGIEEHVHRNDHRFSSMIIAVVNSEPFRMRMKQGDEE